MLGVRFIITKWYVVEADKLPYALPSVFFLETESIIIEAFTFVHGYVRVSRALNYT